MVPVGWQPVKPHIYARDIGDLHIQTAALGGLEGEWWVDADFVVSGVQQHLVPRSVTLVTPRGRFAGTLRSGSRYFPADATSSRGTVLIAADWHFNRDAALPDILAGTVSVEVLFSYGGKARSFTVRYEREKV
jgi:hypothetical protein